jgi:SpoVK/Ycf46/Vps4 family AAA+-type ATPase
MVLLLDEIDALAKKRDDDMDVGEVKRIVTVLLQEIDSWPNSSLLIAATNNPELVDSALWRRFDEEFSLPVT